VKRSRLALRISDPASVTLGLHRDADAGFAASGLVRASVDCRCHQLSSIHSRGNASNSAKTPPPVPKKARIGDTWACCDFPQDCRRDRGLSPKPKDQPHRQNQNCGRLALGETTPQPQARRLRLKMPQTSAPSERLHRGQFVFAGRSRWRVVGQSLVRSYSPNNRAQRSALEDVQPEPEAL